MALIADTLDFSEQQRSFDALRAARRRNRLAQLDRFDAFYKAYVSALLAAVGIYAAAGAVGDKALTAHAAHMVAVRGGPVAGVFVALAIAIGLRSGGRGGPLAFEPADVRHVLQSPLDRHVSIRRPAIRQLRHALFIGIATGAACGLIAVRRMPHSPFGWVVGGTLFGLTTSALAFGTAMIAGGYRIPRWLTDLLAAAGFAWSMADALRHMSTSPFSWVGNIAIWPLHFALTSLLGVALSVGAATWGLFVVNRCSIEAAERRSRLVGQLRFAATMQDVRTVMVLQRQLAQEHLRQRPLIRLFSPRKAGISQGRVSSSVYVRRSLHGLFRWPVFRLARLIVLVAVAAAAAVGVWKGTSPLVVVGGFAMWLAALDLLEPLAQEIDHPDRTKSMATNVGLVHSKLLLVPFAVLFVLVALAGVGASFFIPRVLHSTLLPLIFVIAGGGIGGAALVLMMKPSLPSGAIETPEVASMKFAVRVLLPPAVAVLGFAPLIPARTAWVRSHSAVTVTKDMNLIFMIAFMGVIWSILWVRFADQMRDAMDTNAVKQTETRAKANLQAVKSRGSGRATKPNQPSSNAKKTQAKSNSRTKNDSRAPNSRAKAKAKGKRR